MEIYQRVRVKQALAQASKTIGRPCTIIDSALLSEKVVVIVYKVAPFDCENFEKRYYHQIRCDTYKGQTQMNSSIVRSWFSESQE